MNVGCYKCGGYTFAKPLCGGMGANYDSRLMKRCRCDDAPMQKAKLAFEWIGYFIAISNAQKVDIPKE